MHLKLKTEDFVKLKNEFIIFFVIWLSNGMFPREHIPARIRVVILLVVPILVAGIKCIKIDKNAGVIATCFLGLQTITCIVNGVSMEFDVFFALVIIFALFFSSNFKFEDFVDGFRNVIFWISIFSCGVFFINILFPQLIKMIPQFFLQEGTSSDTYTLFWTIGIRDLSTARYNRNFGVFVEPGQYQIFLCIGFIIELFYKKKVSLKRLVVLIVALITCRATTGFLALAPIIVGYFWGVSKKNNLSTIRKRLVAIFCCIIAFGILLSIKNDFVLAYIEEIKTKILDMTQNYSYTDLGTGLERMRSIEVAWKVFCENPVTGLGYKGMMEFKQNLSSEDFITTFSPLNWFARFGFVFGVLANVFWVNSFSKLSQKTFSKLMIALGMLLMISSQEIISDPFTWILLFYGFDNLKKRYSKSRVLE